MTAVIGPDWEEKIYAIVEQRLAATGIASYADLATSEIDITLMEQFFEMENKLRAEMVRKLNLYATYSSIMREENKMNAFS